MCARFSCAITKITDIYQYSHYTRYTKPRKIFCNDFWCGLVVREVRFNRNDVLIYHHSLLWVSVWYSLFLTLPVFKFPFNPVPSSLQRADHWCMSLSLYLWGWHSFGSFIWMLQTSKLSNGHRICLLSPCGLDNRTKPFSCIHPVWFLMITLCWCHSAPLVSHSLWVDSGQNYKTCDPSKKV